MATHAQWKIEMFGGMRALSADQTLTRFRTQRAAALLARLAYKRGEMQSRDELIEMLWPDCDPADGRNRLNVELSALRKALPLAGIAPTLLLQSDRWSITCHAELVTTDAAEFEVCMQQAQAVSSPLEQSRCLRQALDLYRGPLLPMQEQQWVASARAHYANLFFELSSRFVMLLQAQGDADQAIASARRVVSLDADREEAHELLIRALLHAGQAAAVEPHFARWQKRVQEWGSEPSEAILRLAQQARSSVTIPPILAPLSSEKRHSAPVPNAEWPTGTVTFLVTDIQGSTPLARQMSEAYETARERHHALLRSEFARHKGREYKEVGDGFWVAFTTTGQALACAAACQRVLAAEAWTPPVDDLPVRMGLHVADVQFNDGEYRGIGLHELSRLVPAAHGGQILVSQALAQVAPRPLPTGLQLVSLGEFRLRDAPGTETLFQLNFPGMARTEFPPPNAPRACVPNLPLTFNRFVGREVEQEKLTELLLLPSTRLVTLTGTGGMGKTRLAVETARGLVNAFNGAAYFVPLDGVAATQMVETILTALRQERAPDKDALEQVIALLAAQPTLLVLDNFEELVDEGAGVVQTLLHQVPALTCLITSRRSLMVSMEQEVEVTSLCTPTEQDWRAKPQSAPYPPQASTLAPELAAMPSVQLFVDRARKNRLDFQLTPRNAAAIAELCAKLEGIPLALELAASWAKALSPAQMLTQLKAVLVTRDRDVPERHRSLYAAIEASYRLLSPDLQRFFLSLSVFRGGWTVEAAQEACAEPQTLDYLMQLRERSLILADENGDEMRYRLLEPLREFGEERLRETDEYDAARNRHLAFFRSLAEQANPQLQGAQQAQWLHRLEAERQNLRAALTYADAETRLRIATDLQWFWIIRAQLQEGRAWLEGALSRRGDRTDNLTLKARNAAGILAWQAGDLQTAYEHLSVCLNQHEAEGNERGIAQSLVNLANMASEQGDYASARANYERSLTIWHRLGQKRSLAKTLSNLGAAAIAMKDFEDARPFLEEAATLQKDMSQTGDYANTLFNLALIYLEIKDAKVYGCIQTCLRICLELQDQCFICNLILLFACVLKDAAEYERAAWFAGAVEAAWAHINTPLPDYVCAELETVLSAMRSQLSETVCENSVRCGKSASWEQIIDTMRAAEAA